MDNPQIPCKSRPFRSNKNLSYRNLCRRANTRTSSQSRFIFFFASDIYPLLHPSRKNRRKKTPFYLVSFDLSLHISSLYLSFSSFIVLSFSLPLGGWLDYLFRRLTTFHDENETKHRKKKTNTTGRQAGDRQTTTRFVAVHIFFHFIRKGPCSRESKNPPTPRSYLFVQPIQLKQLFSKSPLRPPMIKSCTKGPRPCASLWTMIFCWTAIHLAIIDNCSRASASAVTLTRSRGDSQFEQAPCATHPLHNTHPLRFYTITIKERRKVLLNSLDNNHQYSNTRRNMTQPIEVCYYYSFFFSFLFPFLGFYYRRRRDYSQSFPPKPKSYAILFLLVFKPNLNPKRFESLLGA